MLKSHCAGGEYVKQLKGRSHCPKTRRIAMRNRMSSAKSVKTKITGPVVTKEDEKRKENVLGGQVQLYICGIVVSVE